MMTALQLAPQNRHVLRSAARLFLHVGDPECAHDLVARNDATKNDPWLIAAEIAIAYLLIAPSRFWIISSDHHRGFRSSAKVHG
jgi:hypothetical protein